MTTTTTRKTVGDVLLPQVLDLLDQMKRLVRLFKVDPVTGLVAPEFAKLREAAAQLGANEDQQNSICIAWVRAGRPLP